MQTQPDANASLTHKFLTIGKLEGYSYLALLFIAMPVFNIGCCGAGGCVTTPSKRNAETIKNITYEEVV